MGRSVGARPRAAVRKEVEALRERLGELDGSQWLKAQLIFDQMVSLCGCHGPSGGRQAPRTCSFCDRYGHTKQSCVHFKRWREKANERELARLERRRTPETLEESDSPEHWEAVKESKRYDSVYNAMLEEGFKGCERPAAASASDLVLDCQCVGCAEWRAAFQLRYARLEREHRGL